ncbi:MAG: PAS domain-containing protein [Candidatus Omnitrophica bacterium]|nr:PAS domain-containing protein [Candidatus Omnitrophota bacterium]
MYEDLTNDDIIAQINNLKASIYKIEYDNHGATDKEIFESDMFRILVENSLDYIAVTKFDIKLTIEYLSPSYQKILNYDISKFIGESKFVFVHPEDKVDLFPKLRRYLIEKFKTIFGKKMREVSERVEYRLKDDQGGFRYVDSIAFNFEDKIYFVGRDITNYVKAQRALQEIKTRFLIAAQSSNALIYEWDIASNKFHWIGDIDGALSYDEGEIERSFDAKTDLLHPDDKHRYMIAIDNLESTGEEFSIEYRIEDKNGDYRYWVEKAKGILNMNRVN